MRGRVISDIDIDFSRKIIAAARIDIRFGEHLSNITYCSKQVRENKKGRGWTLCTQTNGTRGLTSRPTFTIKRVSERERVEESRG